MAAGDEKEFDIEVPAAEEEAQPTSLVGKTVHFTVKVNDVSVEPLHKYRYPGEHTFRYNHREVAIPPGFAR